MNAFTDLTVVAPEYASQAVLDAKAPKATETFGSASINQMGPEMQRRLAHVMNPAEPIIADRTIQTSPEGLSGQAFHVSAMLNQSGPEFKQHLGDRGVQCEMSQEHDSLGISAIFGTVEEFGEYFDGKQGLEEAPVLASNLEPAPTWTPPAYNA